MNKLRLLLTMLVVSICSVHSAWADVEINETNFPDANFRSYLLSEDYGSDGVITDAEIAGIIYIVVDEKNIANLKGIEFFTALRLLSCSNNQLTSLDITKNTALAGLYCSNNQLTALDLSKNSALIYLQCSNNQLTALDVSKNTDLTELYCNQNQLTALDVSKNTNLTKLECSSNQLTSLNVLGCTALTDLSCYSNQLTSLDVTGCTSLGLKKEYSTEKGMISCALNRIKGAAMDAFIASLPANASELNVIHHQDEGNVMTVAQVAAARAKGWKPMAYNETDNTWLSYLGEGVPEPAPVEINETNFTDETFRNYVSSNFDLSQNGKLEYEELIFAAKIDVNKMNIQSMKGVEYFTDLEQLRCKNNQISSINLSKNTLLNKLDMTNNQLTTLDLSKNLVMEYLYVEGNQLTALDVSKHSALRELEASENKLATLDLSNKPILKSLYCDENMLTSLDLSKAPAIENLRCYKNQLTSLNVSGCTKLTSLRCYDNQLTALDVSKNTALTTLWCYDNQLTTLDVSKNTALTNLNCSNNQLTALDVSKNTALWLLNCYQNKIKGVAMDALVSGLPTQSYASLYVIYNENEGNVMTTTQVAAAKAKDWTPYYYDGTDWKEYAGSDPTAIEGIESDTSASKNGSDVYFDLSGRRVMTPTKGVYVKNGRKVVVK